MSEQNSGEVDHQMLEEVVDWLRQTLGTDDVSFEVDPQTVAILYGKMKESQAATSCAQNLLVALADTRAEYRSETERLQQLLKAFGVSTGDQFLSKSGTTSLEHLSKLANTLDLNQTTIGAYMMAIQDQLDDLDDLKMKKLNAVTEQKQVQAHLTEATAKLSEIERMLDEQTRLRPGLLQEKTNKEHALPLFQKKGEEYQARVRHYQAGMKKAGFEPELEHSALVEMGKRVVDQQDQNVALRDKLRGFENLPPDMDLARIQVEEARLNLEDLQAQFGALIEGVSASINPRQKV